MTVKELMNILSKYDEDMIVRVVGGESESGEWAELEVGKEIKRPFIDCEGIERWFYTDFEGEVIMEESY